MHNRDHFLEERLRQILCTDDDQPNQAAAQSVVERVVISGGVGTVINIGSGHSRTSRCPVRPNGLRDVEWRRSVYRDIRQRLASAAHVAQSFGHWLSSVHGAADMTELDDDTLDEALAWVRQRS